MSDGTRDATGEGTNGQAQAQGQPQRASAPDRLRRALGAPPPDSIAELPPPVLERLLTQIEAGRRHHQQLAEDAVRSAIRNAPLPVRGLLRRALQ